MEYLESPTFYKYLLLHKTKAIKMNIQVNKNTQTIAFLLIFMHSNKLML